MFGRRSFHECARELGALSDTFRAGQAEPRYSPAWNAAVEASNAGLELMAALAVEIRREQDGTRGGGAPAEYPFDPGPSVGVAMIPATADDFDRLQRTYRPPHTRLAGYERMSLRDALNKVIHFDRRQAGFSADDTRHELLLGNTYDNRVRFRFSSVVPVLRLIEVILALPDRPYAPSSS